MKRLLNLKQEIFISFIAKFSGMGISYFLVSITLNYLNAEKYGIWMTLLSIISWISFFDIGLGNGMRNKVAQSLARNNKKEAKEYISTAFFMIVFISFIVLILVVLLSFNLNWQNIFNSTVSNNELLYMFLITGILFSINFALSITNQVFYSYQKPSLPSLVLLLSNAIALLSILSISQFSKGNLVILATAYSASQILSRIIVSGFFFKKHNEAIPSLKYFSKKKVNEVMGLGIKFFFIQVSALVIFTTDNLIITQLFGPAEVTPYNISHKIMQIVMIVASIILSALWSAFTDAYERNNLKWIKKTLKNLMKAMLIAILVVFALYYFSPMIIDIWLGNAIVVPNNLMLIMGIFILFRIWTNVFAHFVNGVGRLNVQLITAITGAIINIPLSILFASYFGMKAAGVALGSIVSLSLFAIAGPIQTVFIIKNMSRKEKS